MESYVWIRSNVVCLNYCTWEFTVMRRVNMANLLTIATCKPVYAFCTLETALKQWNILSHKPYCVTHGFKKSHGAAVVCCLGTADSPSACMCCKDCWNTQHSASKFSILFVLTWTFAHSWLIMLFAQEKLKMSFRNSFVRADQILPSPSPHKTYDGGQGGERRETKLLINSQNRETLMHKPNYHLSPHFVPKSLRTTGNYTASPPS